jgi:hypothetical protein
METGHEWWISKYFPSITYLSTKFWYFTETLRRTVISLEFNNGRSETRKFHIYCTSVDRNKSVHLVLFTFMWPCIVINFLTIKPTGRTNFSNLFWKWNSTCFGQFLCPSSGSIHCTLSNHDVPSWSSSKAVYKSVWHIPLLSVQWITPEDGQRNCPKHVDFHFQYKFEKLVHLVGFITRKFLIGVIKI